MEVTENSIFFNFFFFGKKILFELKIQKGVTFMKAQSCSQNKIKY